VAARNDVSSATREAVDGTAVGKPASGKPAAEKHVLIGRIHGAFGVRGELKLESFTEPARAVLGYQPWLLRDAHGQERQVEGARGRETAKGIVATLPDVADRDAAEALRGAELYVPRSVLPPPAPGEYYWVDLEGLRVINTEGVDFGRISYLFPTAANDVLVVQGERERMLPFVQPDVVVSVDLEAGVMIVDWDADF